MFLSIHSFIHALPRKASSQGLLRVIQRPLRKEIWIGILLSITLIFLTLEVVFRFQNWRDSKTGRSTNQSESKGNWTTENKAVQGRFGGIVEGSLKNKDGCSSLFIRRRFGGNGPSIEKINPGRRKGISDYTALALLQPLLDQNGLASPIFERAVKDGLTRSILGIW